MGYFFYCLHQLTVIVGCGHGIVKNSGATFLILLAPDPSGRILASVGIDEIPDGDAGDATARRLPVIAAPIATDRIAAFECSTRYLLLEGGVVGIGVIFHRIPIWEDEIIARDLGPLRLCRLDRPVQLFI